MQRFLSWFGGPTLTAEPTSVPTLTATSAACISGGSSSVLFGGSVSWNTTNTTWHAVDDQVRGGSSQSYLTPLNSSSENSSAAMFSGTLDTRTLGGAGFASQSTIAANGSSEDDQVWDLSNYDGLKVVLGKGDAKKYTLTLKDEIPGQREDGREKSGISWEYVFEGPGIQNHGTTQSGDTIKSNIKDTAVYMPWAGFRATYRGRDKPDAKPLKKEQIRKFGFMMRSFFEEQAGEFELEIRAVEAVKKQ